MTEEAGAGKRAEKEKRVSGTISSLVFSLKIYFLAAIISVAIMELVVFIRRIIRLGKGQ